MADLLLDLGKNPTTRKLVRSLGLPIPMPQELKRARGPWEARPLDERRVLFGGEGELTEAVAASLAPAGAHVMVGDEALAAPFREQGERCGRPLRVVTREGEGAGRAEALVFDASGLKRPADLAGLYDFFHPAVSRLPSSARLVVLGRPHMPWGASAAAAQRALEGFVRSLAKELGRRGSTVQLVRVAPGAEERLAPLLRWLLSPRSAFVSGQAIDLDSRVKASESVPSVRVLEGKVALVTGAARGIGRATAKLLAAEGAHVVCLDRPADHEPLDELARAIDGEALRLDVRDADAPRRVIEHLHQGVDIVVHNAGVTRDKTLARMQPELWREVLDVNLGAVVDITGALLDGGPLRDHGRVVCLSSVAGIAGNMGQTSYAASKAGLIGYVERLASDLAPRGIAVNAVAPGFIETRLTAAIPLMIREAGRRLSNLGQGGVPEDVAQAIAFLASPGASGLCGRTLRVCGGAFIGA